MYTQTIINPTTNRKNIVKCWSVDGHKAMDILKAGGSAKDIGWALLSDSESITAMDDTQHGDSSDNNFALNVFETALDWGLGLAVVNVLKIKAAQGKFPRRFTIAANRNGDVFFIGKNGAAVRM